MELSGAVVKRLTKELTDLQLSPCDGIRVAINEHNLGDITAEIDGPTGTPFEGGLFRIRLAVPSDYPSAPPKGTFLTKIFHPNISTAGEICVNVLKKDWTAETGIRQVLMVVRCLLIEPFPESALNEEAGKLLLEQYAEYFKHARLMTSIHATPQKRSTPLTASGANAAGSSGSGDKPESSTSPLKRPKGESSAAGGAKPSAGAAKQLAAKKSLKRL
ncbi:hypothetical protein FOA52_007605 [Chlamydomonas sp. UWO 241]|nr:hypothetical protein FOA52_007605 [Chlamydomonas sp. UWO 241]